MSHLEMEMEKLKSDLKTGAGSPGEAAAVAIREDSIETERLVKRILAKGYPEGEARLALAQSNNNVEQAIQILDEDNGNKPAKNRELLKEVRESLLGDPARTESAILQLMGMEKRVRELAELINESTAEAMDLLLEHRETKAHALKVVQQLQMLEQPDSESEVEDEAEAE
ncbi:hypothetical protein KR009_002147, partial [Drosophila setifemur]